MFKFKQFVLLEGGNLKVGDVAAGPISVTAKNRTKHQTDIHDSLAAIHDHIHKESGEHLFGADKHRLKDRSVFTGSTDSFMANSIDHKEFAKHKPKVGDVDFQVHEKHKPHVEKAMKPGAKFGKYTVAGVKRHGKELSAVMKHDNGEHHQFDFQYVDHPGSRGNRFLHSSNWQDTKKGIKGLHHKILLNAAGGSEHKFSITHGLRSRTDDSDAGSTNPEHITQRLFGTSKLKGGNIYSFAGVAHAIKHHIPSDQHQAIVDKFVDSVKRIKHTDHEPAIKYLHQTLGTTSSTLKEGVDGDNHVHVSFLGASPFPHQGHGKDIGGSMDSAPAGTKFIGLSGKSNTFSDKEREHIAHKVFGKDHQVKVEKFAGVTVGRAMDHVRNVSGKKHLHLHFGHDRADFAHKLKTAVENGKIPELGSHRFDSVQVHLPADTDRSHGFSGTKMRQAAHDGNLDVFHKHIGAGFSKGEAKKLMDRTKAGIESGGLKLKR